MSAGALRLCKPCELPDRIDGLVVTAVVWDHLGPAAGEGVRAYAEHLAGGGQRVALLTVESTGVALRVVQGADRAVPDALTGGALSGLAEPEALARLAGHVDILVVRLAGAINGQGRGLIDAAGRVCVLAGCDTDGLTKGYQAIKTVSGRRGAGPIELFVVDAASGDAAEAVGVKLRELAWRFLDREVICRGWAEPVADVRSDLLEHYVAEDGPWTGRWLARFEQVVQRCVSGSVEASAGKADVGSSPPSATVSPAVEAPAPVIEGASAGGPGDVTCVLEPVVEAITGPERLGVFAMEHALRPIAPAAVVLTPPTQPEGGRVWFRVGADGAQTVVAVRVGGGAGLAEAVLAALTWADQVVGGSPDRGRRAVIACTDDGAGLRSAVTALPVAVDAMVVHQFTLNGQMGVWVQRLA